MSRAASATCNDATLRARPPQDIRLRPMPSEKEHSEGRCLGVLNSRLSELRHEDVR